MILRLAEAEMNTQEPAADTAVLKAPASDRQAASRRIAPRQSEETLVVDARSNMSPAQMVENRLMASLSRLLIPVSQIRLSRLYKGR